MTPVASAHDASRALFGGQREIGPIGTASRVVVGLIAIGVPIAIAGFTWWDALGALVVLPAIATLAAQLITAAYRRSATEAICRDHAVCSPLACWLTAVAIAATVAFSILTPADGNVFFWVWLGASMLLAAARGYGGCEVLVDASVSSARNRARSF
ncbi:MAG: hypothetical protein AB7V58_00145 [Solirubrobacterales bacterium]